MSESKIVHIGGRDVVLTVPKSYALRTEVWLAANENHIRGSMAALAMCWKGPGRPRTQYSRAGYNPLVFGAQVMDEMIDRGLTLQELMPAGAAAIQLVVGGLVTDEEVKEAEGNSEAEAEVSAS